MWATLLRDWRFTTTFTLAVRARRSRRASCRRRATSRAAPTARCAPITTARTSSSPNPTVDQFFNTAAFSLPAPGTFGNSARNMIIGPGSRQLNAQFSRDVRMGGNRARHAAAERHQPAEHGQLRRRRHGRELADVRPGPVGPADAIDDSSICGSGSERWLSSWLHGVRRSSSDRFGRFQLTIRLEPSWKLEADSPYETTLVAGLRRGRAAPIGPLAAAAAAQQPATPAPAGTGRCSDRGVRSSPSTSIVRDKSGAIVRGLTADRLRGPRGRPAAAGPQLQLRGDLGQAAGGGRDGATCWPASKRSSSEADADARPSRRRSRRRPRRADDLRGDGRAPADDAALRHQLDAARRRAARGRLGAEVREREDERRRPRGGRDRRLDARPC